MASAIRRARLVAVVLGSVAVGCHGIEHPGGPTSPTNAATPTTAITLVASPAQLPAGGGTSTIHVAVIPSDGRAVTIALATSSGELAQSIVVTDSTGHATAEWHGDRSSAIAATMGDLAASVTISVAGGTAPPPTPTPTPNPNPTPAPTPAPGGTITVGIDAGPSPVIAGEPMHFTAVVQTLPPVAVTLVAWDFNADGVTDATGNTTGWTYTTWGSQVASAVVTTVDGRRGEAGIRFLVVRPRDEFNIAGVTAMPSPARAGEAVTWSATVTVTHGVLPTLVYQWYFDGTATADRTTSGPSVTSVYLTPGTHSVRVTATSAEGWVSAGTGALTVVTSAPPK